MTTAQPTTRTKRWLSRWHSFFDSQLVHDFKKDRVAQISFSIFVVFILSAVFANLLASFDPYDPSQYDILDSELPPIWSDGADEEPDSRFILGTDGLGRDLFSIILYGLRISIIIGIFATLLQAWIGVTLGLLSGYIGGRFDSIVMRIADIQLSFSTMIVAIIFLAIFQKMFAAEMYDDFALYLLVVIIGVAEWPQYARTVRANVLAEKKKEYVDAARALGLSPLRIMFRHILPNTFSPIFVISTVQVANAIISEAALSFLGLGMPVTKPSLGSLISSGFEYIFSGAWWITFIPGLVLIVLVLVINLLGDWLKDTLNPRLYKR